MEHIIALKVNSKKRNHFFITWGRLFHPTDPEQIIGTLRTFLSKYGISRASSITLCESLQEVSKSKYFYETIFLMSQTRIPFGRGYERWKNEMKRKVLQGKEFYYLG